MNSRFIDYFDPMHAAGSLSGHDPGPHTCAAGARMSTVYDSAAQRKLRRTMQHVYGHGGNLGNECADHAAALGTLRTYLLTTTLSPVRNHHKFDTSVPVLMAVTASARSWNDCSTLEQMQRRLLQNRSYCCFHHRVHRVSHVLSVLRIL